ncbi:unnamed protein product [Mytilus edulis]|uniref:Uncharacterized protein n=1 Tax=Mytilus edulis TaxID=6550 RepID=A0A8S3THL0_MYTED|nr:unnamed protein product [Mytilus edulis]
MNIDDTTNSDLKGPELNSRVYTTIKDQKGWSALHLACQNGHIEVIKLLIDVGMNINDTTNSGSTPLHKACQEDQKGWSASHVACQNGHIEVVKLLIDVGMNINDTTNSGSTPLHKACQKGHYETVKFLLDLNGQALNSRVNTTVKNDKGWSAFHLACRNGHKEVIKLFIDVGMNIDDTTNSDLNGPELNSRVYTTIKDQKG